MSPDIRDLVIEYCKKLYGVDSVANIVTKGYLAPRGAIRNTARVLGVERDKRAYYQVLADKMAKMVPGKPGTSFADCEEVIREAYRIKEEDDEKTKEMKRDANELLDQAKLVEGVFVNYGMHAAGVIIADGNPIDDYVPLMRDEKSGDMKVQCNMVQAEEEHGLLKFDFLGLRNLKIVTLCIRYIKERKDILIDVEKLPFEDAVFKEIFASGNTGSVFQFESSGMKDLLKNAQPDCFEDLIALVSLYRPGPMDFIPKYIEAKKNPGSITYLCPQLEPILKKTYGCIVYQEQVMEIVQKLAGFSLSQADNVRRYMSKKKMDKLEHERESFISGDPDRGISGCQANGISKKIANTIFDQMVEFAKYAFNKSHAAAYAALSYITAWLKYHYPLEYMCAVLNCTDNIKKMPSVLNDCRQIDVQVLPPDVNESEIDFTVVNGEIRFGLNSVKGTKIASVKQLMESREKEGPFVSYKDFMKRNVVDKGTFEALVKAGALDGFCSNRYTMLSNSERTRDLADKIRTSKEKLEEKKKDMEANRENKRFMNSYTKLQADLELYEQQFDLIRLYDTPEDRMRRMLNEKEVLGLFVTEHPMDQFHDVSRFQCKEIGSLKPGRKSVSIIGVITDLRITARKSDNKPMAFFDLEDKTDTIHVCCFAKAYANYSELIAENALVKITGKVSINDSDSEDPENQELQIFVEEMSEIYPDMESIAVTVPSLLDWKELLTDIEKKGYLVSNGHPLILFDQLLGEFRKTDFYVREDVIYDPEYIVDMVDH